MQGSGCTGGEIGGLVRWTSKFNQLDFVPTTVTPPRCMIIIAIIIENFFSFWKLPPHHSAMWGDESCFLELSSNGFSKKRQTKLYRKLKRNKRAESRVQREHFGTYASSKLPIGFENGPMKVGDHDLHFGQGANVSKCKGNAKELCYIAIIAHIAAWLKCRSWSPTFIGPFSKPIGSLGLA